MNELKSYEKKQMSQIDKNIKNVMLSFEILKNKIYPAGSAFSRSIKYYSDYDLVSYIETKKYKNEKVYDDFKKIFNKIEDSPNLYFLEFKIQQKNGDKQKYYDIDDITKKSFLLYFSDNTDFCKIDFLLWSSNRFVEVSIIYYFDSESITMMKGNNKNEIEKEKIVRRLKDDAYDYKNDGNYFKAMKRLYSVANINNDSNIKKKLESVFNSVLGEKYQLKSKYEALLKAHETFGEQPNIKKRINLELYELGDQVKPEQIDAKIKELETFINNNAKTIYDSLF